MNIFNPDANSQMQLSTDSSRHGLNAVTQQNFTSQTDSSDRVSVLAFSADLAVLYSPKIYGILNSE